MCRIDSTCSAGKSLCKTVSRAVNRKGEDAGNQRVMEMKQFGGVVLARFSPSSLLLLIDFRSIFSVTSLHATKHVVERS